MTPVGNLTAALGYTPGEQKNTLAKLLLVQIDSRRIWNSTSIVLSYIPAAALT